MLTYFWDIKITFYIHYHIQFIVGYIVTTYILWNLGIGYLVHTPIYICFVNHLFIKECSKTGV